MQSLVENIRYEIKNETQDQDQSIPEWIGDLTSAKMHFGQNLEFLTSISGDL